MRRREFVILSAFGLLGGTAKAIERPLVIFTSSSSELSFRPYLRELFRGLTTFGVETGDLNIEYLWADGDNSKLQNLAQRAVSRTPNVIVTSDGNLMALAVKAETSKIPIVFALGGDPVRLGLANSVARPAGNSTGVSFSIGALEAKKIAVLAQLGLAGRTMGVLLNPTNANVGAQRTEIAAIPKGSGGPFELQAGSDEEIIRVLEAFVRSGGKAISIAADAYFTDRRILICAEATRRGLWTVASQREFVEAGALASYGSSRLDAYYDVGSYVARIIKGANPGDLPVIQPRRIELVPNKSTARTLGISMRPDILALADEVIE